MQVTAKRKLEHHMMLPNLSVKPGSKLACCERVHVHALRVLPACIVPTTVDAEQCSTVHLYYAMF